MAVTMPSFLVPPTGQTFFLMEDIYLRGGLRVVPNVAARTAMHPSVRKARMIVITADDGKIWQLQPDNTTWAELRTKTSYFPFFTHDQPTPLDTWVIVHGKDTKYFSYTLFMTDDGQTEQVQPDSVIIRDSNTLEFKFAMPVSGHVTLAFAEQS